MISPARIPQRPTPILATHALVTVLMLRGSSPPTRATSSMSPALLMAPLCRHTASSDASAILPRTVRQYLAALSDTD